MPYPAAGRTAGNCLVQAPVTRRASRLIMSVHSCSPSRWAKLSGGALSLASAGAVTTAAVSSLSWVHDRRFRFAEPTAAQVSSTMQTFVCT